MIEIADYYKDNQQKQNECRQKIWETSGYLLELVNEVLDMGKLESGEIVLEEREFDLKAMLDEIISVIERLGASRGIKINIDYSKVHHFKTDWKSSSLKACFDEYCKQCRKVQQGKRQN